MTVKGNDLLQGQSYGDKDNDNNNQNLIHYSYLEIETKSTCMCIILSNIFDKMILQWHEHCAMNKIIRCMCPLIAHSTVATVGEHLKVYAADLSQRLYVDEMSRKSFAIHRRLLVVPFPPRSTSAAMQVSCPNP